ncbi:uncharacterized protein LOC109862111 [Pseudomyrmex gracilis]|uniref:uncharacterized protein LOC109862111 n=1 Tax=Pseudomyrmex gracilis TaxID=219809 RepID=UPI000994E303|nr:uncharacterized protein LOC109862111 [Pseudomyrmex gracilis]
MVQRNLNFKEALLLYDRSGGVTERVPLGPLFPTRLSVNSSLTELFLGSQLGQNGMATWKEYFVIFIPKPGRREAYRPISLASNILKLLEKIMCRRMEWWVKNNSLISPFQLAFSLASMANNNRQVTGVVFLDVEGAFDNVVPLTLLSMLSILGFLSKFVSFVSSVISFRRLKGYASGIPLQQQSTVRGLP